MGTVRDVQVEVHRAAEAVTEARRTLVQVGTTRWRGRAGDLFRDAVVDEQDVLRRADRRLDEVAQTALHHAHEAQAAQAAVAAHGF